MPRININPDYNPFEKESIKNIEYKTKEILFENKGVNVFSVEESFQSNYSNPIPEVIQALNKYILTKTKNSIIVINQERASQRILFDKFSAMDFEDISCQQLLFPYNHFFSPT